jgi:hypothetical protein
LSDDEMDEFGLRVQGTGLGLIHPTERRRDQQELPKPLL